MNLFYPSHDIALAHGVRHFNPPASALRLQEDLAYLHEIWNQPFLKGETSIPLPWGWDWDTRDFIHRMYGIKMRNLPSNDDLEIIRNISSLRSSITCLEKLREKQVDFSCTMHQYLDSEDKLWEFITKKDAAGIPFVLKTPWSSSGRGLLMSFTKTNNGILINNSRTLLMKQALGTINKMGSIMGEEWIAGKVQDFAMLFYASDKDVRFIGYSLFDNDKSSVGTTYRQGYLLSNDKIVEKISLPKEYLSSIAKKYEEILSEMLHPLFGKHWHLGYLGVDMLTYKETMEEEKFTLKLHPCIELNLRCTMGVVCRLWYNQHKTEGVFRISPMQYNRHFKAEFLPTT